jgi:hypothetical protein
MKARFVNCILSALFLAICFPACESSPPSLYSWGSYELQVYAYLNGESRGEQLAALERDLEKIEAGGKAVPPGFYAHLGLLYVEMGNDAEAIACFMMEKALFPEAAVFMDFLLANYGS